MLLVFESHLGFVELLFLLGEMRQFSYLFLDELSLLKWFIFP